jgi:exopolysaccharide biosynthesis polyprenyl glycosylphosphotransferase
MLSGGVDATHGGSTESHDVRMRVRVDAAGASGTENVDAPSPLSRHRMRAPWIRGLRRTLPEPRRRAVLPDNQAATIRENVTDFTHHSSRERWLGGYQGALVALDLLAAAIAIDIAYVIRFGLPGAGSNLGDYLAVGLSLPLAWVAVVGFNRAYAGRIVGAGPEEFQRIFKAFLHLTALVAFTSFVMHADLSRGFIVLALPLALALDLMGRYGARRVLHRRRAMGKALTSVVIIGSADSVVNLAAILRRDTYTGMHVTGACLPVEQLDDSAALLALADIDLPVLGDVDSIREVADRTRADTIAVTSSAEIGSEKLRWISWQLEGSSTHLVVSPGLIEVAGSRLHIQPVAGLPLLHVEQPEFTGVRRLLKSAMDRTIAGLALIVLSPLLLLLGTLIRATSKGPALFRQIRVGRDGDPFVMYKFRSMCDDAENRRVEIIEQNQGNGLLFKIKSDPRVTRVGRVLRKYSIDELPQLINVFNGTMSLVGPRPPLPDEVAKYGHDVRRRLLVKPGLTGLWQISGRSDLSWDEAVQLDLRYVENWTPALDLMILWKTARAVIEGSGAY